MKISDFLPYLHDEGVYYTYPEDNRIPDNANLPIQTLFTGDDAELPENSSTSATSPTTTTPITASNPLNGALATLATLGIITAGAGAITMTATALAKKKEQDEAKATQMATLQVQQSAQAQSAGANWNANQSQQAQAYQEVATQVTESQANIMFQSGIRNWQQKLALRLEAILHARRFPAQSSSSQSSSIQAFILGTTVSITAFKKDGTPNRSLGTVANYNGQQVIVTHDHWAGNTRPNQCFSLSHLQSEYPFIYIEGSGGGDIFESKDLNVFCPSVGTIFLSLASGLPFNVTQMEAQIAFNYVPSPGETVHYSYIPGFNPQSDIGHTWDLTQFGLQGVSGLFQPFRAVQVNTQSVGSINGLNIHIEYGQAGRGDSGAGLFNAHGELIATFQTSTMRVGTSIETFFSDDIANLGHNWLGHIHHEPHSVNSMYNIISGVNP